MGNGKDNKRHRDEIPASGSSSSGSSSEEDEQRRKRHKSKDKEKKGKKDKKHKKHKGGKEAGGKDKEAKRLVKQAKKFLKQKLAEEGGGSAAAGASKDDDIKPPAVVSPISEDDYFAKNPEFSQWLLETRRTYFNDLTTEQAHEVFGEFVKLWNQAKLPGKFYHGMQGTTMRRTSHNWGVRGGAAGDGRGGAATAALPAGAVGLAAAMEEDSERRYESRAAARQGEATERRRWKTDQKELLEEMLPKATGREALIEKKAARREEARAREESPDAPPMRGIDVMGGGDEDSFAAARAREAQRTQWRTKQQLAKREQVEQRLTAAQAAENQKMEALRKLVAQGPITIRKRE